MQELCDELGIKKDLSTPHHPQANEQIEAVNKTIKHTLKRKLDTSKGAWVDKLPHVLWAIRTISRTATRETSFSMTYGAEAMSPIEVGVPSHRRIHFNEISNDEAQVNELHLLEERRDTSQENLAKYHRKIDPQVLTNHGNPAGLTEAPSSLNPRRKALRGPRSEDPPPISE
ncbi:uncharacterized protein LOC111398432 [Olea europaea var. sylvestris]|uniref:uncharacterized protein LOC111398432 n=1 Tax=Olea europaea var. sylvestris TaxID=158386 RepID=UPI000C1D05DB|nr:uncharacterized protein LOC111398432 [Olea europaea var. sylvestris]